MPIRRAAVAATLLLFAPPSLADDDRDDRSDDDAYRGDRGARALGPTAIMDLLAARGFRDFESVEYDDGIYEVEAYDTRRNDDVELEVHPRNGEIIDYDD